jgi:hypothetical protein
MYQFNLRLSGLAVHILERALGKRPYEFVTWSTMPKALRTMLPAPKLPDYIPLEVDPDTMASLPPAAILHLKYPDPVHAWLDEQHRRLAVPRNDALLLMLHKATGIPVANLRPAKRLAGRPRAKAASTAQYKADKLHAAKLTGRIVVCPHCAGQFVAKVRPGEREAGADPAFPVDLFTLDPERQQTSD